MVNIDYHFRWLIVKVVLNEYFKRLLFIETYILVDEMEET